MIIHSLLDLDLYKLTVLQLLFHRFVGVSGEYEFTCRNKGKADLLTYVPKSQLQEELYNNLPKIGLNDAQLEWLRQCGYYSEPFLQFLRGFRLDPERYLKLEERTDTYRINAKGPLISVQPFETLVLAIVNELYESNFVQANGVESEVLATGRQKLADKVARLQRYNQECIMDGFGEPKIIEFGTRRRFSRSWQSYVLNYLIDNADVNLVGTSNVELAMLYDIPAIGTFGHEFPMLMQGLFPVQNSQAEAFRIWNQEYRGKFALALGDTLGDEKFFKDWTLDLAKAYDGVRHDSGCAFAYGERLIQMYNAYGIDPRTKKIVFSDGLDVDTIIRLHKQFRGRIQTLFGIGTNLTNDLGCPTLQIVMKATMSNGQPVAKLSADTSKASCTDPLYLEYLKHAIAQY